jgi:hypothetical protein
MNFGFNTNVRVADAIYHVQTEDRGQAHPFLDTVVYLSGRVIYKRSTSYEQFAKRMDSEALSQKLGECMAQQHREVIADVEAGTLPQQSEKKELSTEEIQAVAPESLDLSVLNPKTCFAAGDVTLEIELCETNSKLRIGEADVQAYLEQEKQRIPCAEGHTDAEGRATLKFSMPPNVGEGARLVVRAKDGPRYGELRFKVNIKPADKAPEPVTP